MSQAEFYNLDVGDAIRNVGSGRSYVVMANYGSSVVLVDAMTARNPPEWELVSKVKDRDTY